MEQGAKQHIRPELATRTATTAGIGVSVVDVCFASCVMPPDNRGVAGLCPEEGLAMRMQSGPNSKSCMSDGWMDGWMDGRTDGRMDGGMEGWRDGWRDGGMEGWRDSGMEGWRDGGMGGWGDGWVGEWVGGWVDGWPPPNFKEPQKAKGVSEVTGNLGVDSPFSSQKPAVSPGILMVSEKEGSLERMASYP